MGLMKLIIIFDFAVISACHPCYKYFLWISIAKREKISYNNHKLISKVRHI